MAKRKTDLGLGRGLNALLGDPELPTQLSLIHIYGLLEEMGVELDDGSESPVFGGTTEDIPQQVLEDWEKYHNSLQRPSEPEEGEEETTIPGDDVTFPTYTRCV